MSLDTRLTNKANQIEKKGKCIKLNINNLSIYRSKPIFKIGKTDRHSWVDLEHRLIWNRNGFLLDKINDL